MSHPAPIRLFGLVALLATTACETVDLGDNFIAPEVMLDEDFFFCEIQPNVLSAQSCASGATGESGSCHSSRSALRLNVDAETDPAPECDADGNVVGMVPLSYEENLEAVRFTVQSDPMSSPIYRRSTGLDSHPRTIFDEDSAEAQLLFDWISQGAR